ncbi:MAG: class I SAM-dependent DNA methyltransferase [Acidobacteriaceae bacterium]
MGLSVAEFVNRWKIFSQSEDAGSQSHFLNLCDMLGEPGPAASDSIGDRYAFEKHVSKTRGGKGFADVWLRDHFAWEYKGKHKDLKKAYDQLNDYREDLGNPPLLVVCDLDRFEVHTNFTATNKRVYAFNLDDLNHNKVTATCPLPPLEVLRALFGDYNVLRPEFTDAQVTKETAAHFSRLAERLELEERNLGASRAEVAHFLVRLLFCLFADSIGLLPNHVFRNLLQSEDRLLPTKFLRKLKLLFEAMSQPEGIFGEHSIKHFNGGLFDSSSIIQLDLADLGILYEVSKNYDWSHVAPAIFGTLFERSLDPARRSLIGAHYTSEEDILLLIEPVLMRPLEQRWAIVRQRILEALEIERAEEAARNSRQARLRTDLPSQKLLADWIDELTSVRVLDPACGSGNFLYVALRRLLDLWLEARKFAAEQGISLVIPKMVSPTQLFGIETEFYAHELASIVVWIGFLQWKHEHGVQEDREPVLQKLDNIEHGDAILRYDAEGKPYEPEWPRADFIIGNPPWLGGKKIRRAYGDKITEELFATYNGRVPAEADLVTYWFEKARASVESGEVERVGLLATQSIRQGANRRILDRVAATSSIFMAWSDREWVVEGAQVRSSIIAFDDGSEPSRTLDGLAVSQIHPNLQAGINVTSANPLRENSGIAFQGPVKVGKFEVSAELANYMLRQPNPNGLSNAEVIKPWINGADVVDRPLHRSIIDFGTKTEAEAALFEAPFEHLKIKVKPSRLKNRDKQRRERWWRLGRSGGDLKNALAPLARALVTSRVSKHRFFVWCSPETIPDTRVVVFASDKDYFAGLLHSEVHLTWFLATSSRHGVGNDPTYNIETCFDTFPFPWPPGTEPTEAEDTRVHAIADAARELVRLRDAWLNPPDASEAELKARTLTNLYNQRPEWLANAHRVLDEAVFAAYGWPSGLSKQEILARLLALNHERAASQDRGASPSP